MLPDSAAPLAFPLTVALAMWIAGGVMVVVAGLARWWWRRPGSALAVHALAAAVLWFEADLFGGDLAGTPPWVVAGLGFSVFATGAARYLGVRTAPTMALAGLGATAARCGWLWFSPHTDGLETSLLIVDALVFQGPTVLALGSTFAARYPRRAATVVDWRRVALMAPFALAIAVFVAHDGRAPEPGLGTSALTQARATLEYREMGAWGWRVDLLIDVPQGELGECPTLDPDLDVRLDGAAPRSRDLGGWVWERDGEGRLVRACQQRARFTFVGGFDAPARVRLVDRSGTIDWSASALRRDGTNDSGEPHPIASPPLHPEVLAASSLTPQNTSPISPMSAQ